ncbi:MAG: (d)CMP kinase [Erysipelothrix sp.]|jgi:cytidylate kinase|nr:(d)CMP kinase [Erysipelothrix sp.]
MNKINIAIDGPVASGKSTIAKVLAKRLNYVHVDTGAMYRCIAFLALTQAVDVHDELAITKLAQASKIELTSDDRVLCNGMDVTHAIRNNEVSKAAAQVSIFKGVRANLVQQQRLIAQNKGVVMDGRDIGSVVLKDAELKIFQTASVESRAKRRYLENIEKGIPIDYDILLKEINERDYLDIHRKESPLIKAQDAIEIDTSDLTIEAVVTLIEAEYQKVIKND